MDPAAGRVGGIMVNFYLGSISRKNGNSNENCSKIFKRIFLAYRSPISISGPGPQRKDRCHEITTDGLHGSGVHRHRARANERIASAPPHAPRDADRHDLRGSPRLHALETQQHFKVPCSALEPFVDGVFKALQCSTQLHARRDTNHRVSNGVKILRPRLPGQGEQTCDQQGSEQMHHAKKAHMRTCGKRWRSAASRDAGEVAASPPGQADCESPAAIGLLRWPPPRTTRQLPAAPP